MAAYGIYISNDDQQTITDYITKECAATNGEMSIEQWLEFVKANESEIPEPGEFLFGSDSPRDSPRRSRVEVPQSPDVAERLDAKGSPPAAAAGTTFDMENRSVENPVADMKSKSAYKLGGDSDEV